MNALAEALSAKVAPGSEAFEVDIEDDDGDDLRFHNACLDEIDRYRRIDEWLPSYHNTLSTTALDCKRQLVKAGTASLTLIDFLQYTRHGTLDILRINAFSNLMDLGMFKNDAILHWFLSVLGTDPSPYIRDRMLRLLGKTIGAIAIGDNSEPVAPGTTPQDNLIIEQESSTDARKADLVRKQSVQGALEALKSEIGTNEVLKKGLWNAIASPAISLREMGDLLEICDHLYIQESSMIVVLKYPRKWTCTKVGKVCPLSFSFLLAFSKLILSSPNTEDDSSLHPKRPSDHETAQAHYHSPRQSTTHAKTQTPSPTPFAQTLG